MLCAAECLLLLHSALDVVARRRAAASVPALWSRTGRSGGVAMMDRRGRGPLGLALGERPWPLMTGMSAGPCGVLVPSLDEHGAACVV